METILLTCPQCNHRLRIDAGFMGSVCRCSHCGKMISVSAKKKTSILNGTRPERPVEPADPNADVNPSAAQRSTRKFKAEAPPARATLVASASRRPSGPRHRVALVTGVIAVIGIVLTAITAYTLFISKRAGGNENIGAREAHQRALGFDPSENPFLSEHPTFLGVPLEAKAVILVDASKTRRGWFNNVKKSIWVSAEKGGNQSLQVVFGTETESRAFPGKPQSLAGMIPQLRAFLETVMAEGVAEWRPAFERALATYPSQIVMVTEQGLFPDQVSEMETIMESMPRFRLDVILMHVRVPELVALTGRYGGVCPTMTAKQVSDWLVEAGSSRRAGADSSVLTSPHDTGKLSDDE